MKINKDKSGNLQMSSDDNTTQIQIGLNPIGFVIVAAIVGLYFYLRC